MAACRTRMARPIVSGRRACERARFIDMGSEHDLAQSGRVRPAGLAGRARLQQFRAADRPRKLAGGHPQGARCRDHAVRHRRHLWRARRLRDRHGPDPRRPAQGHRACLQIRHGDGRWRKERRLAPLHHGGRGGEPEAAEDRLARPLPGAPARSADPDRGDAARARRSRARRQGALRRLLELHRRADDRGAMGGAASQSQCLRLGARTNTACSSAASTAKASA